MSIAVSDLNTNRIGSNSNVVCHENTVAQDFASKLACVATNTTTQRKQCRTIFREQARVCGDDNGDRDSDDDDDDEDDDRQPFASKLAVVAAATTAQTFSSMLALNL